MKNIEFQKNQAAPCFNKKNMDSKTHKKRAATSSRILLEVAAPCSFS
jgi:hypothetical protein